MTSPPGAVPVVFRLEMDAAGLEVAAAALLGTHATRLPDRIGHAPEDFDLIWRADGSAVLNVRLWRERVPPFRHAVAVIELGFLAGVASEILGAHRRSFGT